MFPIVSTQIIVSTLISVLLNCKYAALLEKIDMPHMCWYIFLLFSPTVIRRLSSMIYHYACTHENGSQPVKDHIMA